MWNWKSEIFHKVKTSLPYTHKMNMWKILFNSLNEKTSKILTPFQTHTHTRTQKYNQKRWNEFSSIQTQLSSSNIKYLGLSFP